MDPDDWGVDEVVEHRFQRPAEPVTGMINRPIVLGEVVSVLAPVFYDGPNVLTPEAHPYAYLDARSQAYLLTFDLTPYTAAERYVYSPGQRRLYAVVDGCAVAYLHVKHKKLRSKSSRKREGSARKLEWKLLDENIVIDWKYWRQDDE